MKNILTIALLALSTIAAFANGDWSTTHPGGINAGRPTDLNATPAQLIARYGKPVKVEKGWYGHGTSYTFQPSKGSYIYATTNPWETKVEDIVYLPVAGKKFTDTEKDHFLTINSDPHITYYGDYREFDENWFWNGAESVKRLGKEKNLLLKSDYNWTHQIVAKETENGGFQVRTKAQFDLEQKS